MLEFQVQEYTSNSVEIGARARVGANAKLMNGIKIGSHVRL